MTQRLLLALTLALVPLSIAGEVRSDLPQRAPCRTCTVRGAAHGEEKVEAWREFEGDLFTFCSKECGETFDAFPEAYVPQPLPRPAPQRVVGTEAEEQIVFGAATGQVLLVDFWATWCAPCIAAMSDLDAMQKELGGEGFSVVGISIDEDREALTRFLRNEKPHYPIVHDVGNEPAWFDFRVAAIPAMFLIDGAGRIVGEWKGVVDVEEVREAVVAELEAAASD